jgi:hypothetical protein
VKCKSKNRGKNRSKISSENFHFEAKMKQKVLEAKRSEKIERIEAKTC